MNKQPEVTARTRRRLMDAYWSLYVEYGAGGVTAGAVARTAGVSRGTFYQYFSDCPDVLDHIEGELLDTLAREVSEQVSVGTPIELDELTRRSARLVTRHEDKLLALLGERGDPSFPRRLVGVLRPFLFANLGLAEDDPRVDLITEFAMSGMVAVLRRWRRDDEGLSMEELLALAQTLLLRGIQGVVGDDATLVR